MQVKKQHFRTRHGTMDWFKIGKGVNILRLYIVILLI